MIGWFPSPYPDELLYSICARYSEAVQYPNKHSLNTDLLGKEDATSIIDLPLHLGHLASVLPPNQTYSVDNLVRRHTLFPFYAPFIPSERVEQIREMMRSGASNRAHAVAGINKSPIRRPDWLRFCPVCVERDRKRLGETYWRRIHQLPGVEVCPDHLTFLESSPVSVSHRTNPGLYVPAEQAIRTMSVNVRPLDREDKSHQILVRLASDGAWLLNQNLDPDHESLRASYHTLLMDRGLVSRGGMVKRQKLMQAFGEVYPPTLLAALQSDFDEKRRTSWVTALLSDLKSGRTHPPLRHLLLIQLLGYTAESFFAHCRKEQTITPVIRAGPFGRGPYPCLNPACQFFRQFVIGEIVIKQNLQTSYLPIGYFTCSCGFSYARRGPDQSPADQLRYDWVKSYGAVWAASLKEMWVDQKISIIEMVRRLGCSRENIVNKAINLGLSHPRCARGEKLRRGRWSRKKKPVKAGLLASAAEQREEKLRLLGLYREQLLSALRQQPEATRTMLRKSVKVAYRWLWEHDRDWLAQQLPSRRKPLGAVSHADWAGRDARLAREVRRAAVTLKSLPEKPVRVVKREIARYLGEYYLLSNSNCPAKLPLTFTTLNEVVETRTDFALRRIRWAEERLREEDGVLTFAKVARRAGIDHQMWYVPEVKAAIEAVLISLQPQAPSHHRSGGRRCAEG
jgi:Tn7-like transposition protein D/TniQ